MADDTTPANAGELEALRSVVRKLVNDDTAVLNPQGYLVVDDNGAYDFGSRSIDLTPEELSAVQAALDTGSTEPECGC